MKKIAKKPVKTEPLQGPCYYIRALNAELYNFFFWEFEDTKNLNEESHPDNTGRRISVFRVGNLGTIYKIRKKLEGRNINGCYYYPWTSVMNIFVRYSPNGQLYPWPASKPKKK